MYLSIVYPPLLNLYLPRVLSILYMVQILPLDQTRTFKI